MKLRRGAFELESLPDGRVILRHEGAAMTLDDHELRWLVFAAGPAFLVGTRDGADPVAD